MEGKGLEYFSSFSWEGIKRKYGGVVGKKGAGGEGVLELEK